MDKRDTQFKEPASKIMPDLNLPEESSHINGDVAKHTGSSSQGKSVAAQQVSAQQASAQQASAQQASLQNRKPWIPTALFFALLMAYGFGAYEVIPDDVGGVLGAVGLLASISVRFFYRKKPKQCKGFKSVIKSLGDVLAVSLLPIIMRGVSNDTTFTILCALYILISCIAAVVFSDEIEPDTK